VYEGQNEAKIMDRTTVKIEQINGIAIMCLDKPPVNAIDRRLVRDGVECLSLIATNDEICAVVITGSGKCFSAGLDLKTVPYYKPSEQRLMVEELNKAILDLYDFPIPTVAAINGHAIAGGFILAISCDYRVGTSSECKLGVTESRVGIPFPVATMEVLRAELAPAAARRMTLVGRNLSPQEAFINGVLDELQQDDKVLSRAKEVARDLGTMPREAYAKIKRQLRGETILRIKRVIDEGSDPLLNTWISNEGVAASAELLANEE
jgi:enoyl-CoA hydratase